MFVCAGQLEPARTSYFWRAVMDEDTHIFERGGFLAHFVQEWTQFSSGWNWRTFHPIMIEIEDDCSLGGIEATIIFLGLGFRVRWNYTETDELRDINERVAEIEADPSLAVPLELRPANESCGCTFCDLGLRPAQEPFGTKKVHAARGFVFPCTTQPFPHP